MKMARSSLIVLLCMGVVLQVLGAPISFWDLDGSDDDFISSLLMGACILSGYLHISPFHSYPSIVPISAAGYSFLHEHFLFRPPHSAIRA